MVRTPRFDKFGMKKGAWSEDEDDKLRAFIEKYGHPNWCELPKFAGLSRSGKSCRLRWMNYLQPNVKHGNFTKEEEDVIIRLHNKLGNKWSKIAALLPGRSDNEIKNHWHTHLNKRVKKDSTSLRNGQIESLKPIKANYPEGYCMKMSNLKTAQDEVGILLAVMSSESPSSSSTSELSSCTLSSAHINVGTSDVTPPQFSKLAGSFWTEPFLLDNEIFISPDNFISQASFQENIMEDEFLWSTMDSYFLL